MLGRHGLARHWLLPALWSPALSSGYGIIIGSIILVTVDAVRCKAGFWAAVAAWVIGYAAMLLYISIPTLILLYIGSAKLIDGTTAIRAGDLFAVVGCLVIGSALFLNRWFARRRRIATQADTTRQCSTSCG